MVLTCCAILRRICSIENFRQVFFLKVCFLLLIDCRAPSKQKVSLLSQSKHWYDFQVDTLKVVDGQGLRLVQQAEAVLMVGSVELLSKLKFEVGLN